MLLNNQAYLLQIKRIKKEYFKHAKFSRVKCKDYTALTHEEICSKINIFFLMNSLPTSQ